MSHTESDCSAMDFRNSNGPLCFFRDHRDEDRLCPADIPTSVKKIGTLRKEFFQTASTASRIVNQVIQVTLGLAPIGSFCEPNDWTLTLQSHLANIAFRFDIRPGVSIETWFDRVARR